MWVEKQEKMIGQVHLRSDSQIDRRHGHDI